MRFILSFIFLLLFGRSFSENAELVLIDSCGQVVGTEIVQIDEASFETTEKKPNPILHLFLKKKRNTKRITAALLAFPFPFGIVGLHRIYLGTKPYVPVAYIASLGGVFGILPFIDFCVILFNKDLEEYSNNGKVLMWIK